MFHHPSLFPPTVIRLAFLLILGSFSSNPVFNRPAQAQAIELERIVIDNAFPSAYQVEIADINGDGKLDIVALGGNICAWYENPSWKKRIVTSGRQTPGIISSATIDLDGDGKAEIAIAHDFEMNQPKQGKLVLAKQGLGLDDPWAVTPITTLGSIHRLRWGDVDGDKRPDLIVAPIFGPSAKPPLFEEEPAHLVVFQTGRAPLRGNWTSIAAGDQPVLHAIKVLDLDGDGRSEILGASNLGVTRFSASKTAPITFSAINLTPGAVGEPPKRGCSEVHVGRLSDGRRFLATVEPWHGSMVAVSIADSPAFETFGPRTVIDDTLKEAHALWVADIDSDGSDEIFAGYRGAGTSLLGYKFDGKTWKRTLIDNQVAAQDLRGGDLDSDGKADFVAVGGSSHNVVWYKPPSK